MAVAALLTEHPSSVIVFFWGGGTEPALVPLISQHLCSLLRQQRDQQLGCEGEESEATTKEPARHQVLMTFVDKTSLTYSLCLNPVHFACIIKVQTIKG